MLYLVIKGEGLNNFHLMSGRFLSCVYISFVAKDLIGLKVSSTQIIIVTITRSHFKKIGGILYANSYQKKIFLLAYILHICLDICTIIINYIFLPSDF